MENMRVKVKAVCWCLLFHEAWRPFAAVYFIMYRICQQSRQVTVSIMPGECSEECVGYGWKSLHFDQFRPFPQPSHTHTVRSSFLFYFFLTVWDKFVMNYHFMNPMLNICNNSVLSLDRYNLATTIEFKQSEFTINNLWLQEFTINIYAIEITCGSL